MDEMEKIEKVQKLSEKTGASTQEAKAALEQCQWDMFEAFLILDATTNHGAETSYTEYTTTAGTTEYQQANGTYENPQSANFGETVGKCVKWIGEWIQKGMVNFLDVERDGKTSIHIPVTIFVLLLLFFHVFVAGMLVIGLFCGFRYAFSGPAFTKGADYGDKDSNR